MRIAELMDIVVPNVDVSLYVAEHVIEGDMTIKNAKSPKIIRELGQILVIPLQNEASSKYILLIILIIVHIPGSR